MPKVSDAVVSDTRKNAPKGEGQFKLVMKRLFKNPSAIIAGSVLVVMVIFALLAPYIIPYDYAKISVMEAKQGPSAAHWFGTDDLGRDIFSRILYGSRYSLRIGIIAVFVSMAIGMPIGAIAGFFGGKVDTILMRFLDVINSIPGIMLSIVISAALGTGFFNTIIALAVGSSPLYGRVLRAQMLSLHDKEYVEAARAINCGSTRIIMKHMLPNTLSPIIVSASQQCAGFLLQAASLSYIGLGIQPPEPEWGAMLAGARGYLRSYPYMLIFPGLCIMVTVICMNILGDALRDAMDPKLKK
jgi:peptide/nickel transport system permease protein